MNSVHLNTSYFLTDHLGNTRCIASSNNGNKTLSYYPFGLTHNSSKELPNEKVLFAGKELTKDFCLNSYDFGARTYNPQTANWNQIDPMAIARESISPYNYVQNNPISRVDPTGMLDTFPLSSGTKSSDEFDQNAEARVYEQLRAKQHVLGMGNVEVIAFNPKQGQGIMDIFDPDIIDQLLLLGSSKGAARAVKSFAPKFSSRIARVGKSNHPVTELKMKDLLPMHAVPSARAPANHIQNLAHSMSTKGYDRANAIVALELPNGRMVLVDGHHRVAAMQKLGERYIPANTFHWNDLPEVERVIHLCHEQYGKVLRNYLAMP